MKVSNKSRRIVVPTCIFLWAAAFSVPARRATSGRIARIMWRAKTSSQSATHAASRFPRSAFHWGSASTARTPTSSASTLASAATAANIALILSGCIPRESTSSSKIRFSISSPLLECQRQKKNKKNSEFRMLLEE